ncbi:hypothetical protein [Oscillatoria sp. HE19RPO]|uniref:hypothetical protein n=1 Tax=Oscillatoria sp. HE19RPO TaxID=2954806 RepID=UPI0020C40072|nr:hypothetical protein [Oscillatoria sp. HE19RPO]
MNEEHRRNFNGTLSDFNRFVEAMKSEGLEVKLESAIPLQLKGSEFEFTAIQLIAILRLSEALAKLLQVSTEEVHRSFLSAACSEACSLSHHEKMATVNHLYSNR